MRFGLDFLALPKYVHTVVREMPEGWCLGSFANTFGDALPAVETVLKTGRVPMVRMQLLWSDSHTFGDKDIPVIRREAKRYQQLKKRFPHIEVELSPFCEHNLQNPDRYLDIVREEAPDCIPVNVPWKGAFSQKYKNEIHGDHKAPRGVYNYSLDGTNGPDANMTALKETHADASCFFFWHCRFNLKWSMKDTTPRPQRAAKPDSNLIDSVIYLHREKGETRVPKGVLLKSHAEKHGAIDYKGDKLLIILPEKGNRIELKTRNGQTVDVLRYYGPFDGGGYRYYSQGYGYQAGLKAIRIQGDAVVSIQLDGKGFGRVNPGFREGSWRK
jgi:hypothetical protein